MSEKTFVYNPSEGGGTNSDLMSMLAMNNGGFGNGNYWWLLFLFLIGRNGYGFGNDNCNGNNEAILQAIGGNANAINNLATQLNCSTSQVQQAIQTINSQLCNIGNQVGMSSMQVINAVQSGDNVIASKLADCCCENRLAICNQTNALTSTITSGLQNIKDASNAGFAGVQARLDAIQTQNLQDKIDALREKNSTLSNQLSVEHQTTQVGQMISQATTPITYAVGQLQSDVDKIKCKLPETTNVPYSPVTAIPNCVAYQYGLGGFGGFGGFNGYNGFWG